MDAGLQDLDRSFKALADPTRVRILGLLAAGEICVCHIHESLRLPQSLVSRHLAYLRRARLVETRKAGLWVYYRLADRRDATMPLLDAIYRRIGQLATVARDGKRLERKTGCCVRSAESLASRDSGRRRSASAMRDATRSSLVSSDTD